MKLLTVFLVVMLLLLQYELWFAHGGIQSANVLKQEVDQQLHINRKLQASNDRLITDIQGLRHSNQVIEQHARNDLGMVKPNETFYQVSANPKSYTP